MKTLSTNYYLQFTTSQLDQLPKQLDNEIQEVLAAALDSYFLSKGIDTAEVRIIKEDVSVDHFNWYCVGIGFSVASLIWVFAYTFGVGNELRDIQWLRILKCNHTNVSLCRS